METKGIAAQGCEVSITNESASNAQGVGSPSEHPWGAVDTLVGTEQVTLQKQPFVSLQGQQENLLVFF